MKFRDLPIKQKLTRVILLTSAIILVVAGVSSIVFDLISYQKTSIQQLTAISRIVSSNSTAALAFSSKDEATEILSALTSEQRIRAASLYDINGNLFSRYAVEDDSIDISSLNDTEGFTLRGSHLIGVQPVMQGDRRLGTLYIKSDMSVAMMKRLLSFGIVSLVIMIVSFLLAYFLSNWLQRQVSKPILSLAGTATAISRDRDYSVRATKQGNDELGLLTDAFNQMLTEIESQNQAIRENEARVTAVLNSSLTSVILMDEEGKIIEWNQMAEKMFGWKKEEVLGKELATTVIPERYRESHRRGLERYLSTQKSSILNKLIELSAIKKDNTEFPVEFSVSTIKVNGTDSFCGFVTDITERKQSEKKIQAQLARLSLLNDITRAIGDRLDLSSIFQVVIQQLEDEMPVDLACVGEYDPENYQLEIKCVGVKVQILDNNQQAAKVEVDLQANKLMGSLKGKQLYEPDITILDLPFFRWLAEIGLKSVVITPLTLESSVFGVMIAARKKVDAFSSGECEFLVQLSDHVALASNQAQLHEDLHKAYEELKQTQQTVLQQERLRALGQMSSGIAHDINNAISPISLYTESLLETEKNLSKKGRRYLEIIEQAMDDVANTVSRMREFYRKREPQLTLTSLNLNHMIDQVIELTKAKWYNLPQERGVVINIERHFMADIPFVMGVESEIREALTNLVFNGIDAMPEGGTLTLTTRVVESPKEDSEEQARFALLEVSDTGGGMDEETRSKCFEPFFTTKGEQGTGLGLAMVYGIVRRHHGVIDIQSKLGEGTTVAIRFPLSVQDNNEVLTPITRSMTPKRKRILVIDDDSRILRSMSDILEIDGHLVTSANGGQAGIDHFKKAMEAGSPYHCVFTDLGMPYVDGRKVAMSVKALSPSIPIVMLTGWGQRISEEGETPEGVDYVMSKPPKLSELRKVLIRFTNGENLIE